MESKLMQIPSSLKCEAAAAHFVLHFFTVTNSTDPKKGGSKNACCMFCKKSFIGCSTARAAAHFLARPAMGQNKAGIQTCVAINKKDFERRGALIQTQKTVGEVIRVKELSIAGTKRSLNSFLRPVMFSLKSILRPRASETCLLTDASTRRSETGCILQPLKCLSTFTRTAKWWQQLVMLMSLKYLLASGIKDV